MPASHDLSDVDRISSQLLDAAERNLPQIAADLDATIVRAGLFVDLAGGMEGTNYQVTVQVPGMMDGDKPTQEDLERALVDAGYAEVVKPESPYEKHVDDPTARGVLPGADAYLSVSYNSDPQMKHRYEFYLVSEKGLTLSNADGEEYRQQEHRTFDQSLVTPLDD